MSPATKMWLVTTPLTSNARQPASQPTPQNPAASPAPSSHSILRIDPSDVTTTSTSSVLPSDSRARRTCPPASPSIASTDTPVRRSTPASRCISAAILPITPPSGPRQRGRTTFSDGDLKAQLPAHRGHLRPDEPRTDDQHAPRTGGQRGLQPRGIGAGAQRVDALAAPPPPRWAISATAPPWRSAGRSPPTSLPSAKRTSRLARSRAVAATPSRHSRVHRRAAAAAWCDRPPPSP